MKIELVEISIRELVEDYADKGDEGVRGYGGNLDIRPQYQREFVYSKAQSRAVIDTIFKQFPLNVMYWAVRKDGKFEIIDGQQRTISICQFIDGDFSFKKRYFDNLKEDEQDKILNYKLMIYLCRGTDSERLQWFKTINIVGLKLKEQEIRNAVYAGSWVSDAKRHFSKNNCAAYNLAKDFVSGTPNRQDYLETAIKWISCDKIDEYMGKHQRDKNANILWNHFRSVINWADTTFKEIKPPMKNVDWGPLYKEYKDVTLDTEKITQRVKKLFMDDDIKKSGIYPYVLTGDEKYLHIRAFSKGMKEKVWEKQDHKCKNCGKVFPINQMEGDHIKPWRDGGKTVEENCQMLCKDCNRRKAAK